MTATAHQSAYFRLLDALFRLGYGEKAYDALDRILAGVRLQPSYGRDLTPRQASSARRFINGYWEGRRNGSKLRERRLLRNALAACPPALSIEEAELAGIKDAVLGLPIDERNVFILCRYRHLSYEQIAVYLGLSPAKVELLFASALSLCMQAVRTIEHAELAEADQLN